MNLLNRNHRPIEILLVEDSREDAETTMEVLKDGRVPNRTHWVSDGEQAIAYMRHEGQHSAAPLPDLILLDLNMPRMNGLEVLEVLKKHPSWKRIPIVMMTASEKEQDILSAYDRHANCYVTKPIDIDKFIEAVRSIEDFWLSLVHLPAA